MARVIGSKLLDELPATGAGARRPFNGFSMPGGRAYCRVIVVIGCPIIGKPRSHAMNGSFNLAGNSSTGAIACKYAAAQRHSLVAERLHVCMRSEPRN